MKHAGTLLKYAGLLLWAACFWMLFDASLDMPAQELREQALTSLQAVLLLLILAAAACCTAPLHFKLHTTDLGVFLLWGLMTAYRYGSTNPATWVRYDELLPAVLLYVAVRIFTATDRRAIPVLLTLLSLFGIIEAWTGLRQIYGFTYSNHGLFRITGSLFNPGPYAGFITPILVCAAAFLVRTRQTAERLRKANTLKQRLRSLLPNRLIRMVIPRLMCWGAVLAILIVLPATMSRAAGVAAAVAGAVFVLKELGAGSRLRNLAAKYPLRFGITTAAAMLLVAGAAFGAYWIKRPSAEGRLLIWKMDTRIILRHPLCGVGPGNFAGAFGAEQARYFSEKERPELEKQVAGCPESGFNEFLQFGAETGIPGLLLLLLTVGSALHSSLRRGNPLGYGLLAATLFACFSYPWSVLPLRLLFVVLLAAAVPNRTSAAAHSRRQLRYRLPLLGVLAVCIACWPGIYNRTKARITARRAWNDTRIWINSGRCDYLVEDGGKLYDRLCYDFRFLYDYGYALHKNGNFRQSNEILAQGATMSSDPMFWNIMGKNFEALGDHARAEDAFMQAHLRIPDRIYPLYLLARHYRDLDRREQAVALARKIVAHKPKIESQQTRNLQTKMQRLIDSLTHAPDPKP